MQITNVDIVVHIHYKYYGKVAFFMVYTENIYFVNSVHLHLHEYFCLYLFDISLRPVCNKKVHEG